MKSFRALLPWVRPCLTLPLVGSLAVSSILILVAQIGWREPARLASAPEVRELAPGLVSARELAALDAQAAEQAASVTREALLAGTALDLLARPGGASPTASALAGMRSALWRVALGSENGASGGAGLLEAPRKAFAAAQETCRARAASPRERSCLEEAGQHFASLCTARTALAEIAARQADAQAQLPPEEAATAAPLPSTPESGPQGVRTRSDHLLIRWAVTLLAAAGGLCAWASATQQARRLAGPVRYLIELAQGGGRARGRGGASRRAAGDLAPVASAILRMSEARQKAEDSLHAAQSSLELKISARTAELWRANKALREESEQRARVEGEFYQAQKMDALGKLAGSIAHDFNNLLTIIIGGTEALQKQIGTDHPAARLLRTVQQAGERAAGLTQPLLTFSRNQVLALDLVDLNAAAEEAGGLLRRLLGVNIALRLDLAPQLDFIKANANQIQQVLVNLGVNARDAMEVNGQLTIETRPARRPAGAAASAPAVGWVMLTVRDTGCGMDAATRERIFEPFFTTKPLGKGTGLGLATVFGIINQLGGSIEVESAPGEGTAFHLYFPGTKEVPPVAPAAVPEPAALPRAAATSDRGFLLLVDDEDDIRELASLTLEESGYQVLTASHAEDAILLAEKHPGKIRALITDVVMPGINGVQLAEVLCKSTPGMRVLFVSGHSKEVVSTSTLLAAHANYLQKPYRGPALVSKVKEVLAAQEARFHASDLDPATVWMN